MAWLKENQQNKYGKVVAPLLAESGRYDLLDLLIMPVQRCSPGPVVLLRRVACVRSRACVFV